MGWLDANEYFLLEVVARDRLDDIGRTIDVPSRSAPEPAKRRPERGVGSTWAWWIAHTAALF